MRAFLAVRLPAEVQRALTGIQRDLARVHADVRWVDAANLHLTLKFLGEISDAQRLDAEALLRRVAGRVAPFQLSVAAVGAFPTPAAPRVVWVGAAEGKEPVVRIAEAIDQEGKTLGWPTEERPFAAHVTIGRVRSSRNQQALAQRLRDYAWDPPDPWPVTSLTLYQSILRPEGPQYSVLAEAPLAKN